MRKEEEYLQQLRALMEGALKTQLEAVGEAADRICGAFQEGRWLYLFGTGHSHMLAEELFYRAGGLVRVKPILDSGLMLHESAVRSTQLERLPGYARILLDDYGVGRGDVLIVISNSGRNSVCVEMAVEARARQAEVIALTSLAHSSQVSSRHASGKRLFELADVTLDNGGCRGDACVTSGERRVGPTSTVLGAALLNALVCAVVERMAERGTPCETFASSNIDGGEEINRGYLDKYRGQIRSL